MSGFRLYALLILVALSAPLVGPAAIVATSTPSSTSSLGEQIRDHYETVLPSLPADKQRHYALRLYRLTGDDAYLAPIRDEVLAILPRWQKAMQALDDAGQRQALASQIVDDYRDDTPKYQRRKALLRRSGELPFAKQLLYRVNQLEELHLAGEPPFQDTGRALAYLRGFDFQSFVLDPEVIKVYSAQTANLVYYLYRLGLQDLREPYQQAFRRVYPPGTPHQGLDLQEKIYGMSHLVIAASGYYQHSVARKDFGWIFDYFERRIDHVIQGTKPDVYTEMALCFLLAEEPDNPAIDKVKAALEREFDDEADMIPATDGSTDTARGEHRNTLVVMLYYWPEKLHMGPDLSPGKTRKPETKTPGSARRFPDAITPSIWYQRPDLNRHAREGNGF